MSRVRRFQPTALTLHSVLMDYSESAKRAWETRRIIGAISIRQPYVEQILRGIKTREYRSVITNIRERVYLYASEKAWRLVRLRPAGLLHG
jgi:hypothetical protein